MSREDKPELLLFDGIVYETTLFEVKDGFALKNEHGFVVCATTNPAEIPELMRDWNHEEELSVTEVKILVVAV